MSFAADPVAVRAGVLPRDTNDRVIVALFEAGIEWRGMAGSFSELLASPDGDRRLAHPGAFGDGDAVARLLVVAGFPVVAGLTHFEGAWRDTDIGLAVDGIGPEFAGLRGFGLRGRLADALRNIRQCFGRV